MTRARSTLSRFSQKLSIVLLLLDTFSLSAMRAFAQDVSQTEGKRSGSSTISASGKQLVEQSGLAPDALNIIPPPIPKARMVPMEQAVPQDMRMWFPEYDGDGFFASLDPRPLADNAQLDSTTIFEKTVKPILNSLGFSTDSFADLPFAIPKHSGIPLNQIDIPRLTKRMCDDARHDYSQSSQITSKESLMLSAAQVHLVHTSDAFAAQAETFPPLPQPRREDETVSFSSVEELAPLLCKVLESAGDQRTYETLTKESSSFLDDLNPIFEDLTGLSLRDLVQNNQRQELYYFFPEVHHSQAKEFAPEIPRPLDVVIEHVGIRVSRRENQSAYSATGRVLHKYGVTNKVGFSQSVAAGKSANELEKLLGRADKTARVLSIPSDWPELVLLPSGEARVDDRSIPGLRYTYRTPAYVDYRGKHLVYVWLDAETGTPIEVTALSGNAGGSARAKGNTLHRDPSLPNAEVTDFRFDPPGGRPNDPVPPFPLHVMNELEGGPQSPFTISPNLTFPPVGTEWNFTSAGSPAETLPTFADVEKIDLFATMYRYLDMITSAPFGRLVGNNFPSSAVKLHVISSCNSPDLARYDEDYEITLGLYHSTSPCPNYPGTPTETGKTFHDHTLVAHEMGHLLTLQQYGYLPSPAAARRQPDWCHLTVFSSVSACPLPVRPSYVHDFADAWVHLFERTNCVAGWMGRWLSAFGDDSLSCVKHYEGSNFPRLSQVPDPIRFSYSVTPLELANYSADAWNQNFPEHIGDHFPEHRKIASGSMDYADMQVAASALWEVSEGRRSFDQSGMANLTYLTRFVQTLATTGWLGSEPLENQCIPGQSQGPTCRRDVSLYSDRDVYRGLVDLEVKLANQWRIDSAFGRRVIDRTINKVTSGFARAGLFMIPPACIDDDPTNNLPFCATGDTGGDAVIDVTDNDCSDDRIADGSGDPCDFSSIRGVLHQDRDYVKVGLPVPGFHVWTGPRYRFSGQEADLTSSPICNNTFRVEVAEDEDFTTILVHSGWLHTSSTRPCYCNWSFTQAEWKSITDRLLDAGRDRLYYRVITCRTPTFAINATPCVRYGYNPVSGERIELPGWLASNLRRSTRPANGLFGKVAPPFAILDICKSRFGCKWRLRKDGIPPEFFKFLIPKPKIGPPVPPLDHAPSIRSQRSLE